MASSSPRVPPAIESALAHVPVPMVAVSLPTGIYIRTNPAWDALFGGRTMEEILPAGNLDVVLELLRMVVDNRIEGYVRRGQFVTVEGRLIAGFLCLRRLATADTPDLAVTVIMPAEEEGAELPPLIGFPGAVANLSIAVTDHDWRIEYVSHDFETRLGYGSGAVTGSALLGLVHPDDALKLLQAIDVSVMAQHAAIAHVRLRAADRAWRELTCVVTPLCHHDPPRLAILRAHHGGVSCLRHQSCRDMNTKALPPPTFTGSPETRTAWIPSLSAPGMHDPSLVDEAGSRAISVHDPDGPEIKIVAE